MQSAGQLGAEFGAWVQAALALRFSADPALRLAAIECLRDEVPGALPGGSVTVSAALARLQLRKIGNPYAALRTADGTVGEEGC